MLCPACLVVLSLSAANQLANSMALVVGTRSVNFQASAVVFLSADLLRILTRTISVSLGIYVIDIQN